MSNDVKIILEAVDNASAEIKKTTRSLDDVGGASIKAGAAFGGLAAAGAAVLVPAIQLAARAETLGVVTKVMGKNIGMSEVEVRKLENAIRSKGITMIAARQSIASMIQAEIDLTHATDLARAAQDTAVVSQKNSSEAFQDLVTIIATGNILMARNAGLMVNFEAAYKTGAEAIGKTSAELTNQEKIQIRTNEVLRAASRVTGAYEASMTTAAKKMASLDRHTEESQRMLGEIWLPTYAAAVDTVTKSLKKWQDLDQTQKDSVSTALGYATAIATAEAATFLAMGTFLKATKAIQAMDIALKAAGLSAGLLTAIPIAGVVAGVTLVAVGAAKAFQDWNEAMGVAIDSQQVLRAETATSASTYEEYRAAAERAAQADGLVVDEHGNLIKIWGAGRSTQTEVIEANAVMTQQQFDLAKRVIELSEEYQALDEHERRRLEAMGLLTAATETHTEAIADQVAGTQDLQAELNTLKDIITGPVGKAYDDFMGKTVDLRVKQNELKATIQELEKLEHFTPEQFATLREARAEYAENELQLEVLTQKHEESTARIIFGYLEQAAARDGLTTTEITALTEIAKELGIYDQKTADTITNVIGAWEDYEKDQSLPTLIARVQTLNREVAAGVVGEKTVTVRVEEVHITGQPTRRQHGGPVEEGMPYIVGEAGPELFVPARSGNIINNFELTANYASRERQSLAMDVKMLVAQYG